MTRKGLVCLKTVVPLQKKTTRYQEVPHSIDNQGKSNSTEIM